MRRTSRSRAERASISSLPVYPLTTVPPLTWSVCPDTYEASSDAKNITAAATSKAAQAVYSGVSSPKCATLSAG